MAFNTSKRAKDMYKRINDQRSRLQRMNEADKRDQALKDQQQSKEKKDEAGSL